MKIRNILFFLIASLLICTACILPFSIQPSENLIAMYAQQTVEAYQSQNAPVETLAIPTLTSSPQPTSTSTPHPTSTAQPTVTSTPTPTSTLTPSSPATATPRPCNEAIFISETIPDGTMIQPGKAFIKSWRVKNTGTCTWNPNYMLVFARGSRMSGPQSINLGGYVKPGEKSDLVIDLKAPDSAGTYTGYWKLQADDGYKFAQFWVNIKVPVVPFAVTRVKLSSSPSSYAGTCPGTVTIKAEITTNSAGTVTYQWDSSDSVTSSKKSVKFTQKGTKTVQFDLGVTYTNIYWVKIYIDSPNHLSSSPLSVTSMCFEK